MPMPNVAQFFGAKGDEEKRKELEKKIKGFERLLENNEEDMIDALNRQLAGEISAKASHALEIIRLKERRQIERENEAKERKSLQDELKRLKELLAAEQRKNQKASEEAN